MLQLQPTINAVVLVFT